MITRLANHVLSHFTDKKRQKKNSKVKHNFQEIELATELKYKPRTSHSKPNSSLYYLRKLRTEMEKVPSICT